MPTKAVKKTRRKTSNVLPSPIERPLKNITKEPIKAISIPKRPDVRIAVNSTIELNKKRVFDIFFSLQVCIESKYNNE